MERSKNSNHGTMRTSLVDQIDSRVSVYFPLNKLDHLNIGEA